MPQLPRKTRTVKMSDEEWANVIRFRAELESVLGRRVPLGEALAISAKLNLFYISFGKDTKFTFIAKGGELEKIDFELGKESLKRLLEEMKRIFGIVEKESETLKEYKKAVVGE